MQVQYGVHTIHSNNLYQIYTYVKNYDKDKFYNTIRIHKRCDYLSPDTYEKEYYANQTIKSKLNNNNISV